jgi:CheY-like chemotaxis protein
MQILLIDDNEKLCKLYQQLLIRGGHETRILTDSAKAMDTIRESPPDLILLDIMMEPVSGWEVLEQIRSSEEFSELPVIILTGKVLTAQEALQYGLKIEGFVMKPLERTMLLAAIDEAKDLIDESDACYSRALLSGLSPEKAFECKKAVKTKKILLFLRDTLTKQETLLKKEAEHNDEILHSLDDLRAMITQEFQKIAHITENCP